MGRVGMDGSMERVWIDRSLGWVAGWRGVWEG